MLQADVKQRLPRLAEVRASKPAYRHIDIGIDYEQFNDGGQHIAPGSYLARSQG